MLTADGAGLLRDIIDHPDDDALRLIYADWLEESGDADRAEFVRVQIEADRRGYAPDLAGLPSHRCLSCGALWDGLPAAGGWSLCSPACGKCWDNEAMGAQVVPLPREDVAALQRQDELVRFNMTDWLRASLPEELLDGFGTWQRHTALIMSRRGACRDVLFRRGFVEAVSLRLQAWLDHGRALVRAHPLRRVVLSDREPLRHLDGYRWEVWSVGGPEAEPVPPPRYALPRGVFALLTGGPLAPFYVAFPTLAEANAALSDAALGWARGDISGDTAILAGET